MDDALAALVWRRAGSRCEYCHLHQDHSWLTFEVDHILAKEHGGKTVVGNLALTVTRGQLRVYFKEQTSARGTCRKASAKTWSKTSLACGFPFLVSKGLWMPLHSISIAWLRKGEKGRPVFLNRWAT